MCSFLPQLVLFHICLSWNSVKFYVQKPKIAGRWQDMGSELFAVTDRTNQTNCLSPASIGFQIFDIIVNF